MSYSKTLRKKLMNASFGFLTSVMFFFIGQYMYWQVYPYPTADVTVPITVSNIDNEVSKTGTLKLLVSIDKQSDYTPLVSRTIYCGELLYLVPNPAPSQTSVPQGSFTVAAEYPVPDLVPVGSVSVFEFRNEYQVNPVRRIVKVWQSEPFTVIE